MTTQIPQQYKTTSGQAISFLLLLVAFTSISATACFLHTVHTASQAIGNYQTYIQIPRKFDGNMDTQTDENPKKDSEPGGIADYGQDLLPQHAAIIRDSGITPQVAQERGYRSVTKKAELKALGFTEKQCRVPALLIPVLGVTGNIVSYQIRPDAPRVNKQGKLIKYETPAESKMALDIPPQARPFLGDPTRPLFITEGVRKADSAIGRGLCCIDVLGVWNFRGTNDLGGKTILADWEHIHLKGRDTYITFDSDVMLKIEVHQALIRLKAFLESRGAKVHLIYLPSGTGACKQGLDDFLAAGNSVENLLSFATDTPRQPPSDAAADSEYVESLSGIFWNKPTLNGPIPVQLTNFKARIISDISHDDGKEISRRYGIRTELAGNYIDSEVPAADFAGMGWVAPNLGPQAIVSPGFALKDHARAGIQHLSKDIIERHIYTHAGWRLIQNVWVYLSSNSALGAGFPISVKLEEALERYSLPQCDERAARRAVINSLRLLDIAPKHITIPLLSSVYLAPLASFLNPDFVLWVYGKTGSLKSTILALYLCHFGPTFTRTCLPADWHSTANFLEKMAFLAKDLPFLIDDFTPAKNPYEANEMERKASYLIRAVGNRSGKGRMRSDTSLRPAYAPRCLLWSTGEQLPSGQSEMARLLGLELRREDVNISALTEAQAYAQELAPAMSYYILHLRELLGQATLLHNKWQEYRSKFLANAIHLRTPEIAAHLMVGFGLFISFAQEIGVITDSRCSELHSEAFESIPESVRKQDERIGGEDPIARFAQILVEQESQGLISLSGPPGDSRIELIGWTDPETGHLLLFSGAAYKRVTMFCRDSAGYFPLKEGALHKALKDAGILIPASDGHFADRAYDPRNKDKQIRVLRLIEPKFRALAVSGNQYKTNETDKTTLIEEES
jgi:hypothetical protein